MFSQIFHQIKCFPPITTHTHTKKNKKKKQKQKTFEKLIRCHVNLSSDTRNETKRNK